MVSAVEKTKNKKQKYFHPSCRKISSKKTLSTDHKRQITQPSWKTTRWTLQITSLMARHKKTGDTEFEHRIFINRSLGKTNLTTEKPTNTQQTHPPWVGSYTLHYHHYQWKGAPPSYQ